MALAAVLVEVEEALVVVTEEAMMAIILLRANRPRLYMVLITLLRDMQLSMCQPVYPVRFLVF